jgi:hypothetical protein
LTSTTPVDLECCRRVCIDPYSDLRDVLTRLPRMTNRQVKVVTPAAWAKAPNLARSRPAAYVGAKTGVVRKQGS